MHIVVKKSGVFDVVEVHGRIDGLSSAELKQAIDQFAEAGVRRLVVDCAAVTYISSAGLRVFIQTHKSLSLIGGKMVLMAVPATVRAVFRISGMENFMSFTDDIQALENSLSPVESERLNDVVTVNGFSFERSVSAGRTGRLQQLGSPAPLLQSAYAQADVVVVPQHEIAYGAGLAVLGNEFEDYKNLFGEAVIIDHRFFSYPAVKRPFVDFSGFIPDNPTSLNFLNGFGFSGEFSGVLKISHLKDPASIDELLGAARTLTGNNLFGVVILAVSAGIYGMHLRKSPVRENNPEQFHILDDAHFAGWMNFPVDGEDIHKIIIATGIVVKDSLLLPARLKPLFPANSGLHLHAVVFENGLLSLDISEFENELQRVMKEFEAQKVVHLLSSSQLHSGFIGIINLEAN